MFEYVAIKLISEDDSRLSTLEVRGTYDKELSANAVLELLLKDPKYLAVQDAESKMGYFHHKYIKLCTAKIGYAL